MQAEQTEAHITEILKHEEAPLVSEESTPSSTDMEVDNVKGTDGGIEEDAGAKNDNKDEKESEENDDIVAKDSTAEHDETIYEITNEEVSSEFLSMKCEKLDLHSFVNSSEKHSFVDHIGVGFPKIKLTFQK